MTAGDQPAIRMPAEWEPHNATWLAYPHRADDWPGKLTAVRWAFLEFVHKLQLSETVRLLVRDSPEAARVRSTMRRGGAEADLLNIHVQDTDRSWLRDSGPTFISVGRRLGAVCWRFNGWARYSDWRLDEQVGRFIAHAAGAEVFEPRAEGRLVTMEGGAIESNGRGTLLTTEQCLLSHDRYARNPGLSRDGVEGVLREALGAKNILWLGRGIAGDDTSGHVDTVARFVGPRRVAAIVETDSRDENCQALQDNLRRLRAMHDEGGRALEVVELPMPRALYFEGCRLPASYANFYIANGAVLAPTFNDPNDRVALRVLEECFPEREVCGIHCVELALGLGGLHCLAQQQPRIG